MHRLVPWPAAFSRSRLLFSAKLILSIDSAIFKSPSWRLIWLPGCTITPFLLLLKLWQDENEKKLSYDNISNTYLKLIKKVNTININNKTFCFRSPDLIVNYEDCKYIKSLIEDGYKNLNSRMYELDESDEPECNICYDTEDKNKGLNYPLLRYESFSVKSIIGYQLRP